MASVAPGAPESTPGWWPLVRDLRPVLPARVEIHRHLYRGQRWYVLRDASTGRHHLVSPIGWEVVARLDGMRTLEEVWQEVAARRGTAAPQRVEILTLAVRLRAADLVVCEVPPAAAELIQCFTPRVHGALRLPPWLSPLRMRFALADPDRWLVRMVPYVRPLLSRAGLVAWCGVVCWAVLLAGAHWAELSAGGFVRVLDPDRLALLLLLYPLMKALHEAGHALAIRVWGGEVHELGVAFLVFMPLAYVDASASAAFPDKRRRMAVAAAGVMVELLLASLALFVWLAVEPGTLRNAAWVVMLIGGTSTLLFNGNPLLRYDGYYVLADWIEIPNLATRARAFWIRWAKRVVLGLSDRRQPRDTRAERAWQAGYGAAAFLYRLLVMLAIALFVAERFVLVGAVFLLAGMVLQVVWPLVSGLRNLRADPRVQQRPRRAISGVAGATGAAVLFLGVLPLPSRILTEGVVWLPERSELRAGSDGFVARVLVEPGTRVETDAALVETIDPEQHARVRVLEAHLREIQARHQVERQKDLVKAGLLEDDLHHAQVELARARARVAEATLRAATTGRLVLPGAADLPGRFVHRGELLGYVADLQAPMVRAVVTQADILRVRNNHSRGVEVRLTNGRVVPGRILREVPTVAPELPSLALGSMGGGRIAVDTRDREGLTAAEPVYQLDVALPPDAPVSGIGAKVRVRFLHPPEPLARRALRGLRELFLGKFEA